MMLTDTTMLGAAAWDASSLSQLKNAVRQDPQSKPAQLAVARQVEGMFVQMMLKSMRAALPKDGLFNSEQTRLYTSLYDQQIAQQIGERGLGLADLMVRQMTPETAITDANTSAQAAQNVPMKFDSATVIRNQNQWINQIVHRAMPVAYEILPGDNREFLMKLAQPARMLSEQSGIPHRLILAQAALESGWGQRQIRKADGAPSFNLFGIKANADWKGSIVEAVTTEYENGVAKKVKAKFRAYHSYLESLTDYVRLLTQNPRYASVMTAQTAEQGARALQHAGYATDPAYAHKLTTIIQQIKSISDKVSQAYSHNDISTLF